MTAANVRDNLEAIQNLRLVTGTVSYSSGNHIPQKSATIITVADDGSFKFVKEIG